LAHVRTQRVATDTAELAASTGDVKIHSDVVTRLYPLHLAPNLSHLASHFEAHNEEQHVQAHTTRTNFESCTTDIHVLYPHKHLMRGDGRY
jgi:hypothetical protein